jgi:hypothetical protein
VKLRNRNIYYYLFYRVYSNIIFVNKRNDIPGFSAFVLVTVLVGLNITTLMTVIKLNNSDFKFEFTRNFGIEIAILLLILNWFLLYRNGKYKNIIAEYSKNDSSSFLGSFCVFLYVLLSVYSFFHFGHQVRELNKPENFILPSIPN